MIDTEGFYCDEIASALGKAEAMRSEHYCRLCENSIKDANKYYYKELTKELRNVFGKTKTGLNI